MFIYIASLALMICGASAGVILALQTLLREGRLQAYDAKGYWVVCVLVMGFLVGALAYFWGVSRFGVPEAGAGHEAVVGLLFTVFGFIVALGAGLFRLRTPPHRPSSGPLNNI